MSIEVSPSNIKAYAKNLKAALSDYDLDLKHSQSLEILSKTFGYRDWNTLSAKLNGSSANQSENHLNVMLAPEDNAKVEPQIREMESETFWKRKGEKVAPDAIFSRALELEHAKEQGSIKEHSVTAESDQKKSLVFRSNIAIDLGTANSLVFLHKKGIVIREPTVVAVQKGAGEIPKVLAVGNEAKSMMGRTPGSIQTIRPLKDGVIANFDVASEMMRHIIKKIQGTGLLLKFRPRIIFGVPSGITQVERRAFKDMAKKAGAREVFLVEQPMAAAIGAGLPVVKPNGSMIVDIGAGKTEVAIISLAGIVYSRSSRVGGDKMDETIIRYFKKQHNLLIAETTAEQIKFDIGSAYPFQEARSAEVTGRNLLTGHPKMLSVKSEEIQACLAQDCDQIVDAIQDTLQDTPPKLSDDIKKSGIVLTGGGSLLKGLEILLRDRFDMPVSHAEDPLTCVAMGVGAMLDNIDLIKAVTIG